jgi:MATE family multidrug resistance protein
MALGVSIYMTIVIGLMGVIHALIPIAAQHFGGNRPTEVGAAWSQAFWLALALSIIGAGPMMFPDMWLAFSGAVAPDVRSSVAGYLYALVIALPAALLLRTLYALGTAVSRPKVIMTISVIGIGLKAMLNWIFIFGNLGAPALGAIGAGLATAVVYWLSVIASLWWILQDPYFKPFQLRISRPRWVAQKELLRLGLPMGGSYLVEVCAFTFMALLVAREGTFVSGGHQIMANLAALCYMMPMALGVATSSLTAQAIGANHYALAQRIGKSGLLLGAAGALLTSSMLLSGQSWIINAYTSDPQVAAVAGTLLTAIALFHLCDSMQCINSYILRAYKIAVVPLIMQVLALSLVGLLGGWWLGFGGGRGLLDAPRQWLMPGSPQGAGTMWMMAMVGLGLSASLLHAWYRVVLRRVAVAGYVNTRV